MRDAETPRASGRRSSGHGSGSAVIFALLACLVASIAVQMLVAAVVCGHRALGDETLGRELLAAKDEGLALLREMASEGWGSTEAIDLAVGNTTLVAGLAEGETSGEWRLTAEVSEQGDGGGTTSAAVERGRDGVDLPLAALVADWVVLVSGRTSPWLVGAGGSASAYARVVEGEAPLGGECAVCELGSYWSLGDGWKETLTHLGAYSDYCVVLSGEPGQVMGATGIVTGVPNEHPVLLAVLGGADLDLRYVGDFYGVVLVDGGSLAMEGTVVHGGVLASKEVDLGCNGQIAYEESALRWARDCSLTRTRLVPGSRREVTE